MPVPLPKLEQFAAPSVTELRREIEAATAAPEQAAVSPDPRDKEEYDFSFSHKTQRGETLTGEFTNKILTIGQRSRVANLRARLQGGLAFEAFEPLQLELNRLLAHMEFSLTRRPDWAKDLEKLTDIGTVLALGEEVGRHEATFHRLEETESKS